MTFHGEVLNILLEYREKNPDFNFVARQLNRNGKLDDGYYFQGNDKYAFAGIINKSGGLKMTKSVGLIFFPIENYLKCDFEIKHQGETNEDLLDLYENLKSVFPAGEHLEDDNFNVPIGEIDPANPAKLYQFLDKYYPKIKSLAEDSGLKNLIISDEKFDKILQNIQQRPKDVNYWIFQGSPEIYDLKNALKANAVNSWTVAAHKKKIKPGDKVIIWQTGTVAGCIALGEVLTEPAVIPDTEEEKKFYKKGIPQTDGFGVKIKITRDYSENPILWEEIKELPEFSQLKVGNQGTNFSATQEEFESIKDIASSFNTSSYNSVKRNLDPVKVQKFIDFLGRYVKEKNLAPQDPRLAFNVRVSKNRLVFLIGNRYAINIEKMGGKTIFSFISPEKLSSESGVFKNKKGEIEANWNIVDHIDGYEEKIKEGFDIELDRNHKSPFRRFSDPEFVKEIFNNTTLMAPSKQNTNYNRKFHMPLNTILYGPPGTGKTFKLQNDYFDLFTVRETSLSRKQYLENLISELTWWQVITMVMIDLKSARNNEIYEHELIKIKEGLSKSESIKQTLWGQLQVHTKLECENVKYKGRTEPLFFWKDKNSVWTVDEELVKDLFPEAFSLLQKSKSYSANPDKQIKNYEFVTFHQSFSYEDFVEGIKPKMEEQENDLSYEIKDGIFKKLCLKATADPENQYAIFIDEINRGNVSSIFGELITLIEDDKRIGEENALTVKLPYSKKEFGIPSNLHVIGTMNTADRSVEALDTALRRRFTFEEILPLPHLLSNISFTGFYLDEVLETINKRIEALLDRDHCIGHSYFIKITNGDIAALAQTFQNKIIPLLQEYFYHDYEKIALILGKGFVERKEEKVVFAKFSPIEDPEILPSFELRKSINIEAAVRKLLNHKDEEKE